MGFGIKNNADGAEYGAKVDSKNRLHTFSIVESEDRHLNEEGKVHSAYFSVTPAGANDYFFYMKNTGVLDLFITDIRITSTVASTFYYNHVSGTPSYTSDTDITTTNRNLGSSKTLTAIIKSDTDTTGLTNEGTIFFEEAVAADTRYHVRTSSNIMIPQGSAFAIQKVAATGVVECIVSIVEGEA